jgi:hypothetical protein
MTMTCKPKVLKQADVEFRILAEQDAAEVRGNALASGDDAEDKAAEDEILARLDRGDVWAWASVTVEARYHGLVGRDYLGCCNYASEKDFVRCGDCYEDMKARALEELQSQIDALAPAICE